MAKLLVVLDTTDRSKNAMKIVAPVVIGLLLQKDACCINIQTEVPVRLNKLWLEKGTNKRRTYSGNCRRQTVSCLLPVLAILPYTVDNVISSVRYHEATDFPDASVVGIIESNNATDIE